MSVSDFDTRTDDDPEYAEDVIPVRRAQDIAALMTASGYSKAQAVDLSRYFEGVLGGAELAQGDVLRICVIQKGQAGRHRAGVGLLRRQARHDCST